MSVVAAVAEPRPGRQKLGPGLAGAGYNLVTRDSSAAAATLHNTEVDRQDNAASP